jgi:hypothetical protein
MQEFFRTLLNWRKNTRLTHTGKLIHFVPKGSTYVYGRYDAEDALMVILNKGKEPVTLEMERYLELTGGYETGKDVLSGETFSLQSELEVPALRGLILELE